jgi:hypothetical protein
MQFKQDALFFPNRFYLQRGQGSSNEFYFKYKPFYLIIMFVL